MSCEMVLIGALVDASSVRTARSVMFASENWVRKTAPTMPLASRQRAAGCAMAGVAARTWENLSKSPAACRSHGRTGSGRIADKLGGDLEILWRFQPKPAEEVRRPKHDPEKCVAVFGKVHVQTRS